MSRRDPLVAVQQMRDNAQRVLTTMNGRSRTDIDADEILEAALIRWMEVIGEAARRVPDHFRARYTQVPWQDTTDLRNVLIHGYDTVDLDVLWRIIRTTCRRSWTNSKRSSTKTCRRIDPPDNLRSKSWADSTAR